MLAVRGREVAWMNQGHLVQPPHFSVLETEVEELAF